MFIKSDRLIDICVHIVESNSRFQLYEMWLFIKTAILLFIVSLIVLYLLDHIIEYMKNTYTTKKTKDIMGTQIQKYKMMMDDMYEQERLRWISTEHPPTNPTLSSQELASVNDDLENFIKSIA